MAPSDGAPAGADPIVGRKRELESLHAALDVALDGVGGAVALIGDQGMGKTRLASEVAARARDRGFVVCWGRAWEGGGAPAYWPWVQVVRGLIESLGDDFATHVGDRAELLSQIVPEVAKVVAGSPGDAVPANDRFALFDALATMLMRISRGHPLLVVLEDLHAADEGSLHLLDFVVRSVRDGSMLVLWTYSDPEAPPEVRSILSSIASYGRRIELKGLERDDVAEIYERFAGNPPTVPMLSAMYSATEGNPFFVEEAMRLATSIGDLHRPDHSLGFRVPEGAREVVERRLGPLPEDVVKVLAIASVIGREFDLSTLQEICDTPMEPLLDTLSEATKARIVREIGALGRYTFAHVLIRETLYESLASGERMRLHRLIGEVLENRYRDDLEANLDQLAHHFFKAAQAGDKTKTYDYLVRAATHARSLTAFEEAARLFGRALKIAELAGISSSKRASLARDLEDVQLRAKASLEPARPGKPETDAVNRFTREGDYWTITYEGSLVRMKDAKGLHYLAYLLDNPGREVHALDLVGVVEGRPEASRRHSEPDLRSDALGDAGAVLDATAKAQYRRRLEELQEDIEEAEQFADSERAARSQEEMDALLEQLAAAVGLGGRDRKAASQAERARLSVTKAVKSAVTRIGEADPSLGRHLVTTVRTGTYCSYNPDPRVPADWNL